MTNPVPNPQSPIIFFGNGPLADFALATLSLNHEIIFHARSKSDLTEVAELKKQRPEAHAVLASFGVIIKPELLTLFEPEGIINIHPSLLPKYRGASPIESAILTGEQTLGVSIMKLSAAMDAGPIYHQESIDFSALLDLGRIPSPDFPDAASIKTAIYRRLAEAGASWLSENLARLPEPKHQDDSKATFCSKLDKSLSPLTPESKSAAELHREIIAFATYPRSKIILGGHETLVLASHLASPTETPILPLRCHDGQILSLDRVQPAGKKPMDAKSFRNGYLK